MTQHIHLKEPPVSVPASLGLSSAWREVIFLVKASRPGFWLTAMWFYLLPLWPNLPLHKPEFWLGLAYCGMPLGMMIYALNDVTDQLTDQLNPRKDSFLFGARPTEEQISRLPLRVVLIQIPFGIAFLYLMGPVTVLWFAGGAVATGAYNAPRFGAKDRPGFDVLAQVGYLMVFVLACWLNGVTMTPWYVFVYGALFAMHSHLFGQIMDYEPDKAAGRSTTAVTIGTRKSKLLIVGLMLVEAIVAYNITAKPWLTPFLLGSAVWFALDGLVLWKERQYAPWQMAAFFVGWNLLLLFETGVSYLVSIGWVSWPFS